MANEVVEIQIRVVGADQAKKEINNLSNELGVKGVALGTILGNAITKSLELAVGGVKSIIRGIGDSIKAAAAFEDIEVSLTAMTGSSTKAQKALADLQALVRKTPLQLQDAQQSLTKLIGVGFDTDEAVKKIGQLSDILSGTGRTDLLDNVVFNLGQIRSNGKAATIDLRQFATAGIPIYEELRKVTGKTGAQVADMIENGQIGIKEIEKVFESLTSKGGRFFQLSEKRSKTFNGILSNIKDTIFITMANLAKETGLFDFVKDSAQKFYDFINTNQGKFIQLLKDATKLGDQLSKGFASGPVFKTIQEAIKSIAEELPKILPSITNLVIAFNTLASSKVVSFLTDLVAKGIGGLVKLDLATAASRIDVLANSISALGKAASGDFTGMEQDLNKAAASSLQFGKDFLKLFGVDLNQTIISFSTGITQLFVEFGVNIKKFVNEIGIAASNVRVKLAELVGDTATADAFRQQIADLRLENETLDASLQGTKKSLDDLNLVMSLMPEPKTFQDVQTNATKAQEFTTALHEAGIEVQQLRGFGTEAMQKIAAESTNSRMFVKSVKDEFDNAGLSAKNLDRTSMGNLTSGLQGLKNQAEKASVAISGISRTFPSLRSRAAQSFAPFADGGIVGGNSTRGDKVLARVNSGEMILNRQDQTRLFQLIKNLSSQPRQVINASFDQGGKSPNQAAGDLAYILGAR